MSMWCRPCGAGGMEGHRHYQPPAGGAAAVVLVVRQPDVRLGDEPGTCHQQLWAGCHAGRQGPPAHPITTPGSLIAITPIRGSRRHAPAPSWGPSCPGDQPSTGIRCRCHVPLIKPSRCHKGRPQCQGSHTHTTHNQPQPRPLHICATSNPLCSHKNRKNRL